MLHLVCKFLVSWSFTERISVLNNLPYFFRLVTNRLCRVVDSGAFVLDLWLRLFFDVGSFVELKAG